MKTFAWLGAAALAVAVVLYAFPARTADQGRMDAETEQRLRSLDGVIDELRTLNSDQFPAQRATRGERLNDAFVALTGEAVNPLFGVTALGMYRFFTTPPELQDSLPLYDQPVVWLPLLCIILLMLFNSTICEAMPFLKIPLNALGDIVNKAGAVAVLPLVVKMFADQFALVAAPELAAAAGGFFPLAFAGETAGTLSAGGAAMGGLGWIAGAVLGFVIYGAVWLTFNMIDVLILICPFPGIDATLKSFRLAVIGVLTGVNELSPGTAVFLAAVIVGMSVMLAGWSFRLSVFGLIFSTDILLFRKRDADSSGCGAFSCGGMFAARKIPMRTWGTVRADGAGNLVFSYRPWLVLGRREVPLGAAADFTAGRGLLNPFIVSGVSDAEGCAGSIQWLRLPPRYRGAESGLAETFGLRGVVDCGVGGALRTWLGELFGSERAV